MPETRPANQVAGVSNLKAGNGQEARKDCPEDSGRERMGENLDAWRKFWGTPGPYVNP